MLGGRFVEKQQWRKRKRPEEEHRVGNRISLRPISPGRFFAITKNYGRSGTILKKGLELTPDATIGKIRTRKNLWLWAAGKTPRLLLQIP